MNPPPYPTCIAHPTVVFLLGGELCCWSSSLCSNDHSDAGLFSPVYSVGVGGGCGWNSGQCGPPSGLLCLGYHRGHTLCILLPLSVECCPLPSSLV